MNSEKIPSKLTLHGISPESRADFPLAGATVSAGFPSPADDYMEAGIDLNRELIRNPGSTFFGRVKGTSMKDSGINDGDVLIIDKSVEPSNGAIAVCYLDGEFTVKRIRIEKEVVPFNGIHMYSYRSCRSGCKNYRSRIKAPSP
jgi:DNA polymerase V